MTDNNLPWRNTKNDEPLDLKGGERREIPGYPGYAVDRQGNVFGRNNRPIALVNNKGYRQVCLMRCAGKRAGKMGAHRAVVLAWIGPIAEGLWVNHINGIKHDNRVENLEIVTPKENIAHARFVLKRKFVTSEMNGQRKLEPEVIAAIRVLHRAGWSQRKIARVIGVSQPCICQLLTGTSFKGKYRAQANEIGK